MVQVTELGLAAVAIVLVLNATLPFPRLAVLSTAPP